MCISVTLGVYICRISSALNSLVVLEAAVLVSTARYRNSAVFYAKISIPIFDLFFSRWFVSNAYLSRLLVLVLILVSRELVSVSVLVSALLILAWLWSWRCCSWSWSCYCWSWLLHWHRRIHSNGYDYPPRRLARLNPTPSTTQHVILRSRQFQ